jgi:alkyl hydroperoxide reductase subunit AhpC
MEYSLKPRSAGGLGELEIPLLSDISTRIANNYGCLISKGSDTGLAFRATFIIDSKGIVRHAAINDLEVGRNPKEYLRMVKAFQFTDGCRRDMTGKVEHSEES